MKLVHVFFSDLVSLTVITCGKLIGYEKARDIFLQIVPAPLLYIKTVVCRGTST